MSKKNFGKIIAEQQNWLTLKRRSTISLFEQFTTGELAADNFTEV